MRTFIRQPVIVLSLLACAALSPASVALAEGDGVRGVPAAYAERGFTRQRARMHGQLEEGRSVRYAVRLEKARQYLVIASCGSTCGSFSLRLFSPEGIEIGRDHAGGDDATVGAFPLSSGRYQIVLTMNRCQSQPCTYDATLLGR